MVCLQGFGFNDPTLKEVNMVGSDVTIVGEVTPCHFQSDVHGMPEVYIQGLGPVCNAHTRTGNGTSVSPVFNEFGHYRRLRER